MTLTNGISWHEASMLWKRRNYRRIKNFCKLLITVFHAHVVRMEDNSAYESEQAIGTFRLNLLGKSAEPIYNTYIEKNRLRKVSIAGSDLHANLVGNLTMGDAKYRSSRPRLFVLCRF